MAELTFPPMPALSAFHPAVSTWIAQNLGEPTAPQREGWPSIRAGLHTLIAAPTVIRRAIAQQQSWRAGDPFSLGVASGSPRPDGFVLWTRLAPAPLSTDPATPGGVTDGLLSVSYEIASDPGMRDVVLLGMGGTEG